MMRHWRSGPLGFLIAGLFVATIISSRVLGAGRTSPSGGTLLGVETVQLAVLALAVVGIVYLAASRFTGGSSLSAVETSGNSEEAALEALKERYVAGEINDVEYERRLQTLFETETVADAKRRVETTSTADEETAGREIEARSDERAPQRPEKPTKRTRSRSHRGHCK